MKVMKFGGTSVGSPERIAQVRNLINDGERNIVVASAMSGDTNALIAIAECFEKGNLVDAFARITDLYKKYTETIRALITDEMTATMALSEIDNHLAELADLDTNEIMAKGEVISTTLLHYYLMSRGIKSALLPALLFMRTLPDGTPDYKYIAERLTPLVDRAKAKIIITQGFICRDCDGRVSNLQRGGSDFSATIIGSVLHADDIQIWTDIDGLRNNDPRYVDNTVAVRHISHTHAAALAYFGAKILHPLCIAPASAANVAVKLLNTFDPEAPGTLIDSDDSDTSLTAVAARDGFAQLCDGSAIITFSDSHDTYTFLCDSLPQNKLTAVYIVGDFDQKKIGEMLAKAGITPISISPAHSGHVAVVATTDKINALKAFT